MGRPVAVLIKLFLLCLVVGLVMAFFHITPAHLITDTFANIGHLWDLLVGFIYWSLPYAQLGAWIVIPIVAIVLIMRVARR